MKKIFFILILTWGNYLHSQNNTEDVIYLKNGSIIRGIIIEQIPNQSLKIKTNDRNVFVFKFDEIEKFTKEELQNTLIVNQNKGQTFKKNGFINLTEINYCLGVGDIKVNGDLFKNEDYSFGLKTTNGYQFNEHFSLGIALGFDKYRYASFSPVLLDLRVKMIKGRTSPVLNISTGYSFGISGIAGGLTINPSFGINTYIFQDATYFFNIGYKLQQQTYEYTIVKGTYYKTYELKTEEVFFQFINVSTGFSF